MIIFILAGGLGTRLRSAISDLPKPLAPINNIPFLDYQIKEIKKYYSENKIYLLTHYQSDKIEEYYSNNNEISIICENELLGTGGSIKNAIKVLKLSFDSKILVLNGDTYLEVNLKKFVANSKSYISILSSFQEDCSRYGSLEIKDDFICDFKEKKRDEKNSYINSGCYFFNNLNFFEDIKAYKFSIEEEFIKYLTHGKIRTYKYDGIFIDIGIPSDYEKMKKYIGNNK